ncbi:MAG: hypothetical protein KGI33_12150 [Thaumarchaeota archaeon]|nr:hypothetical protein [Nitrososphaerota archaeon]
MVLPLVDQHRPKCFLCSRFFDDLEALRAHQESDHKDFVEFHSGEHSPAPGDVAVF